MTAHSRSAVPKRLLSLLSLILIVAGTTLSAQAQIPDLQITVGDTTGATGQQNSVITVFMDNVFDSVCAFELWLQLDRPDIMEFQTDLDTVVTVSYWRCLNGTWPNCIDSVATTAELAEWSNEDTVIAIVGSIDTVGTMIGGWEFLRTRSETGTGLDIKVTGQANLLSVLGYTPGVAPQQGGVLFRLLGDILNVPDTLTDRTVKIIPQPFLEHFSFSRCDGTAIGILTDKVPDTNCFDCTQWAPPPNETTCLNWVSISCTDPLFDPGTDSIHVDTILVPSLDTTDVKLYTGSLTVLSGICGNLNCDPFMDVDIADLTTLIDHLFITFEPLCSSHTNSNINCDPFGDVDIADLTTMIDHLFITFVPLECCP